MNGGNGVRGFRLPVVRRWSPRSVTTAAMLAGATELVAIVVIVFAVHEAPRTDASPIEPDGHWLAAYRVGVLCALLAYTLGLFFLHARRIRGAPVVVLAAAIQLAPLGAPLLLSKDVYTYWDKGRIAAVHHRNIFATAPSEFPSDPAYQYVAEDWRDREFFYGPTMAAVAPADAAVAGTSRSTAVGIFRVIAALSVVAVTVVVARVAPRPVLGAALVGWNPILALHFAGGGHNDALMMALFAGSVLLAASGRRVLANVAWLLAVALKWILLVFVPLQVVGRKRSFGGVSLAIAGTVLVGTSFVVWGTAWITSLKTLRSQSNTPSSNSIAWWLADHIGGSRLTWSRAIVLLFVVAYIWLLLLALRTGTARIGLAACLLVAATPFLGPWYLMWPATLTALEVDDVAVTGVVLLTAWLLRDAVGF